MACLLTSAFARPFVCKSTTVCTVHFLSKCTPTKNRAECVGPTNEIGDHRMNACMRATPAFFFWFGWFLRCQTRCKRMAPSIRPCDGSDDPLTRPGQTPAGKKKKARVR